METGDDSGRSGVKGKGTKGRHGMKTILVVEDDRVYARVVANWLVKNGLEARYVLSVASAKEFIAGTEVGLVLSDYRLQDGNGVELL